MGRSGELHEVPTNGRAEADFWPATFSRQSEVAQFEYPLSRSKTVRLSGTTRNRRRESLRRWLFLAAVGLPNHVIVIVTVILIVRVIVIVIVIMIILVIVIVIVMVMVYGEVGERPRIALGSG